MLIGIVCFGTSGYYFVEHMPLFESFYMTVITISTVGYAEIMPLTQSGRALTIIIIILGITVGAYTIGMLVRAFIEGELLKIFGRKLVQKQVSKLKNHYIVCGFGRIGRIICNELAADDVDFVVIEQDPVIIEKIESKNYLFLEMDATSEEALLNAGIMKAKGIATALRSDANNVFITLTAKGLRPDIYILARASHENNEDKLSRAGASRVVSPHLIGGKRMAQVLKRPTSG
jgi:voltage-gated potassium channel